MERPAEMVPDMENKVARIYLRRADFEQRSLSEGCPGCRYLRTGHEREQAHSCRKTIEGMLEGWEPHGGLRLTKESIVHWLTQLRGTQSRFLE